MKMVKKVQKALANHVTAGFKENGIQSEKYAGATFLTLAYTAALDPELFILRTVMDRLLVEDERLLSVRDADLDPTLDFTKEFTPQALAQLFGLSERSQRDPVLLDMIRRVGVCASVKTYGVALAREDLVAFMVESIATRKHCSTDNNEPAAGGVAGLDGVYIPMVDLVSEDDAKKLMANEGRLLDKLVAFSTESFRALSGKLDSETRKSLGGITKTAVKRLIGQRAAKGLEETKKCSYREDHRQQNQTVTDPGPDILPYMATSTTPVDFSSECFRDWANHVDTTVIKSQPADTKAAEKAAEKAAAKAAVFKQARLMVSEFAVLAVERAVSALGDSRGRRNKFDDILASLDSNGFLAKAFRKDVDILSTAGVAFFEGRRLDAVRAKFGPPARKAEGGGDIAQEKTKKTVTDGDGGNKSLQEGEADGQDQTSEGKASGKSWQDLFAECALLLSAVKL